MNTGVELIATERQRQIDVEGYAPEHDDEHTPGSLRRAAATYLLACRAIDGAAGWLRDAQKLGEPYLTDAKASVADPLGKYYGRDHDGNVNVPSDGEWPFDAEWWKPSNDPVRNLVKAGALIAAEIDRLLRAQGGAA